jgi:hypothetical protein
MNSIGKIRWTLAALGLFLALLVGASSGSTPASAGVGVGIVAAQPVPTAELQPPPGYRRPLATDRVGPPMRELKRYTVAAPFLDHVGSGDGSVFTGNMVNNGFDAWFEIVKWNASMTTQLDSVRLDPGPEPPVGVNKGDDVSLSIVHYPSGQTAVRAIGTSHFTDPTTGRPYILSAADITDMGATYSAQLDKHYEGQPIGGAVTDPPPGGSGLTEADRTWIKNEIRAGIDELDRRFGDASLRDDLEGKVKDALLEMMVKDYDSKASAYQYWLYLFHNDRAYQGASSALEERGIHKPPTPTRAPTPRP